MTPKHVLLVKVSMLIQGSPPNPHPPMWDFTHHLPEVETDIVRFGPWTSRICSWQPHMTPKHVLLVKVSMLIQGSPPNPHPSMWDFTHHLPEVET
jgi:hypothetical protein